MRQLLLFMTVLFMTATAGAQDWEGDLVGMEAGQMHATLGATLDSQYVWRGFEVFGSKSATHVFADVDLFETGFGIGAVGHYANGSGYVDLTRYDYTLYYQNGLFASQPYATNYRIGYVLYDYPKTVSEWTDMQEMHLVLSWPNLLPIEGLCPSYVAAKTWPSEGGSYIGGGASGWFHIFMLDYGFIVPGVIPQFPEHVIKLHGEVVYNGGVNPYGGFDMDSEFTHFVLGASTDLDFGEGVVLTPSVYYQRAMDTGIEWFNDDETTIWGSLSLKYSF